MEASLAIENIMLIIGIRSYYPSSPYHHSHALHNLTLTLSQTPLTPDYTRKRIAMDRLDSWDLRCGFLEAELARTRYGYAMTPFPNLGGLDVAGMFMDRVKFVETKVYFSESNVMVAMNNLLINFHSLFYSLFHIFSSSFPPPSFLLPLAAGQFTDPAKYICPGCQDGYFISEVIQNHLWTVHRAPIVKLSSIIYHGLSPLWCIASGNVWYDHPGKIACLSHKTVGHLHSNSKFDWDSYYQFHGQRICLRMSKEGFADMKSAIIE